MKKALATLLILILAAAAIAYFIHSRTSQLNASVLAPADTVVLIQMPDIGQTRERWKETALHKIAQEPEIQAFLARPKSNLPKQERDVRDNVDRFLKTEPKEGYVALTSISNSEPKLVAGFSFNGKKADVEALVADLKKQAQAFWPAMKTDIEKYQSSEIQTLTANNTTVASVVTDHWCFLSNDTAAIKATLDRAAGANRKEILQDRDAFKTCVAKMPAHSDVLVFVQPQSLVERLFGVLAATGQQVNTPQLGELKKVQAASVAMKFEGENIHDATFVLKPGSEPQGPLERKSSAITSADTLVYYASLLGLTESSFDLPPQAQDPTGMLGALTAIRKALESQGLGMKDFLAAFGPEFGSALDWSAQVSQPSLLLSLDVRDQAKAQKFVDLFTGGQFGIPAWGRQQIDGTQFYALQTGGLAVVTPTLVLTDKILLLGLSLDSVKAAAQRFKSGENALAKNGTFQRAESSVTKPTTAFSYIDSRGLFERVYGTLRPIILMWATFAPKARDYVDVNKLPATETISKHLGPIVYSQSQTQEGAFAESIGPVTFSQAVLGLGVGVAAAVVPRFKEGLPGATGAAIAPPPTKPIVPPAPQLVTPTPSPEPTVPAPSPATSPSET